MARDTERSDGGSRPPIFGIDVPVASPNRDPVGWKCPSCTFVNKPARPGCEICSTSRPADYQPPLDYEYDDSEKELIRKLDEDEETMRRVRDKARVLLPVCACTVYASVCVCMYTKLPCRIPVCKHPAFDANTNTYQICSNRHRIFPNLKIIVAVASI